MPASGPVVASYLLDRSREVDDSGALAHSAGRLKSWIDVIDANHVEADLSRIRSAPPVPTVLSSLIRYQDRAKCRSFPAVNALEGLLEAVEVSLEGVYRDRARALLLIGAVGGLTYASLTALRFGDVLADPGDGLRVSTSSADTIWIPVIRQAQLCPACAFVRWCAHITPREELMVNAGKYGHVCVVAAISSPAGLEESPLFRRLGTRHVEALTVRHVASILDEVLQRAGQNRGELDGLRDELLMADLVYSLGPTATSPSSHEPAAPSR